MESAQPSIKIVPSLYTLANNLYAYKNMMMCTIPRYIDIQIYRPVREQQRQRISSLEDKNSKSKVLKIRSKQRFVISPSRDVSMMR
jgi:hypothetical protein